MISSVQRLSLSVSSFLYTGWLSIQTACAQNLFGNLPNIGGGNDIRGTTETVIIRILDFMALVAVVLIVIAGIRLVVSQGEEGEKDKAKKTILYVAIGLVIIFFARALVQFIAYSLSGT